MKGNYGKTPQYWMGYVIDVERLHLLHYAINTNNIDLRISKWDEAVEGCFSMNKITYARLGTYYVMQMKNLDHTHPGAREELERNGMSVCRNKLNIRQSIDGAGESTFMKDAKSASQHQQLKWDAYLENARPPHSTKRGGGGSAA